MATTPTTILDSLASAEKSGIDLASPKAVVDFMLAQGERQSILYFYKPNSVEFDFDKYDGIVQEMRSRKNQ